MRRLRASANHFFDLYEAAQAQPHWAAFQFTPEEGGNVSRQELESATQELDERTFHQEFQASFENLGVGLAYHAFQPAHNVHPLGYDPKLPLVWSLDFNMNPLCSVLGQMHNGRVHILDELILPDSNTLAACEEFLSQTRKWTIAPAMELPPDGGEVYDEVIRLQPPTMNVYVYGDATGEQRKTSASRTDWQRLPVCMSQYSALPIATPEAWQASTAVRRFRVTD